MRHFFVINPKSFIRAADLKMFLLSVKNCFPSGSDVEYEVYVSRFPRDAIAAVNRYCLATKDCEPTRIYAVGGDGILFDCLNGMIEYPFAQLACVPYSHSNDFIRSLGKDSVTTFRDIEMLLDAPAIPIDIMDCGASYAMTSCSIGAEAAAVLSMISLAKKATAITNKWNIVQNLYKLGAINSILDGSASYQYYNLHTDLGDISGEYTNIGIGNVFGNGGGSIPVPEAVPNDGYLHAVTLARSTPLKTLSYIKDYTSGKYSKHPKAFNLIKFKTLTASSDTPMKVVLDGEPFYTKELTIRVIPKAIKLAVPKGLEFLDGWGNKHGR